MKAIFMSASVPIEGRGEYYKTANPFLIQCAVRELVKAVIQHHKIVWGGHPSITPMIWSICEDLNVDYSENVILYQSRHFEDRFPEENERFGNVIFTDDVQGDQNASLLLMRETMLSREDLDAAVFIGGMNGVEDEYELFQRFHPNAIVLPVVAPGGAALLLAEKLGFYETAGLRDIDFASLFHRYLNLALDEHTLDDNSTDSNGMTP
ncbi:MAG: SLOG domain-containing protein [Methylobacter sp.]